MCETSKRPADCTRVLVLGDDAGGILHGHRVAGEGHHARAKRAMLRVQRSHTQRFCLGFGPGHTWLSHKVDMAGPSIQTMPPLSGNLRDFPHRM